MSTKKHDYLNGNIHSKTKNIKNKLITLLFNFNLTPPLNSDW